MNEVEFRNWLIDKGTNRKVASDTISRLKRIEREINPCDIDEHYRRDNCEYLLSLFLRLGKNEEMNKIQNTSFPIGKYSMSTFRYALNQYIQFLQEITSNTQ